MAERKLTYRLKAFSIFEVTVVLALLGVLITIISVSLNRFNEQLKINSEIQTELNHWMLVRSSLWKDYYNSDSLQFDGTIVSLFQKNRIVHFQEMDDELYRKENDLEWRSMGVELEEILLQEDKNKKYVQLSFPVKGELMELHYYFRTNKKNVVNQYFDQLNE